LPREIAPHVGVENGAKRVDATPSYEASTAGGGLKRAARSVVESAAEIAGRRVTPRDWSGEIALFAGVVGSDC